MRTRSGSGATAATPSEHCGRSPSRSMTVPTVRRRTSASRTGPIDGSSRSSASQAPSTPIARRSTSRRRFWRTRRSVVSGRRTSRVSTRSCGRGVLGFDARETPPRSRRVSSGCLPTSVRRSQPSAGTPPGTEAPTGRKEAAYFENAELPRLFAELDEGPYRTVCLAALKTGMRQGELLGLRLGRRRSPGRRDSRAPHLTGGMGTPKNHERRDVDLTPEVVELLGWWWGECGRPAESNTLVFPGQARPATSPPQPSSTLSSTPRWSELAFPESGRPARSAPSIASATRSRSEHSSRRTDHLALAPPRPQLAQGHHGHLRPLGTSGAQAPGRQDGRRVPRLRAVQVPAGKHRDMSAKARAASRRGRNEGVSRQYSRHRTQPSQGTCGVSDTVRIRRGCGLRVFEVFEELLDEHPQEAPANLRALAELFVTAERLSEWVAARDDGGVSAVGKISPPVLEARRAWALYLEKARELGVTGRGGRELAALPEVDRLPGSRLARHLRGEERTRRGESCRSGRRFGTSRPRTGWAGVAAGAGAVGVPDRL